METMPDGLPPGRLAVPDQQYAPGAGPALWVSDEPAEDAGPLFARLLATHPQTGLWPLLLTTLVVPVMVGINPAIRDVILGSNPQGRPWLTGELAPVPAERVAELDPGQILARNWDDTGDGATDLAWPGLADPSPAGGPDPDQLAAAIATSPDGVRKLTSRPDPPHIGLVPAADGAEAIATVGWMSQGGDAAEKAAVVRSWQQRFGGRLCSLGFDTLGMSVARPPVTAEHARRVAAEHFAFCPDIAETGTFDKYAASLPGARIWTFWWD